MTGVGDRRQNAAKERSLMLWPNSSERILQADSERNLLKGYRRLNVAKSQDRWAS